LKTVGWKPRDGSTPNLIIPKSAFTSSPTHDAPKDLVLIAFDADESGDRAAGWWIKRLENARRLRPWWKDANQMLQDEVDLLNDWVLPSLQPSAESSTVSIAPVPPRGALDDLPDDVRHLFVDVVGKGDFGDKFYNKLFNELVNPETFELAYAEMKRFLVMQRRLTKEQETILMRQTIEGFVPTMRALYQTITKPSEETWTEKVLPYALLFHSPAPWSLEKQTREIRLPHREPD
jgi:hypothetical protein